MKLSDLNWGPRWNYDDCHYAEVESEKFILRLWHKKRDDTYSLRLDLKGAQSLIDFKTERSYSSVDKLEAHVLLNELLARVTEPVT